MLKNLSRSPAYARMRISQPSVETDAMRLGSAVHCAVLETDDFDHRYDVAPAKPVEDRKEGEGPYPRGWSNTKVYKERVEEMRKTGKVILKADEMELCRNIQASVHANQWWIDRVFGGDWMAEASVFADDGPLVRKVRPDLISIEEGTIIDLKTCADPRPGPFARACVNFGYHISAAYYLDTINMVSVSDFDRYLFVAVAKDAPFEMRIYELDADSLEQGRHEYQDLLVQWMRCAQRDQWPTGPVLCESLRLPGYAINYMLDEDGGFDDAA